MQASVFNGQQFKWREHSFTLKYLESDETGPRGYKSIGNQTIWTEEDKVVAPATFAGVKVDSSQDEHKSSQAEKTSEETSKRKVSVPQK